MTIGFKCSECGQIYKVKDDAAGRAYKCKSCGAAQQVPIPDRLKQKKTTSKKPPAEDAYEDDAYEDDAYEDDYGDDAYEDDGAEDYDAYEDDGFDAYDDKPARTASRSSKKKKRSSGNVPGIVTAAGILMMIVAGLNSLLIALAILGLVVGFGAAMQQMRQIQGANFNPQALGMAVVAGVMFLYTVVAVLEFLGGLRAFKAQSFGMALTGAIITAIPCIGGMSYCSLVTVPIGIFCIIAISTNRDAFP
ncbi:MAG: hypothetical protein CMJ78_26650 [Planctomycetaceae bacterium]|nr:hypothetical protein [Planctomycetaceae bacterium]